jgi:hypothetical protein
MKVKIKTASTLGNARGNVTLQKTCQPVLPEVVAASSNEGSIQRKGVAIKRNTIGIHKKLSTSTIPLKEKMLKSGAPIIATMGALRMPALGPMSMIHPTTFIMPGIANDTYADT